MVFIIFLRKGSVRHGIYFEGSAREKRLRNADLGFSVVFLKFCSDIAKPNDHISDTISSLALFSFM